MKRKTHENRFFFFALLLSSVMRSFVVLQMKTSVRFETVLDVSAIHSSCTLIVIFFRVNPIYMQEFDHDRKFVVEGVGI